MRSATGIILAAALMLAVAWFGAKHLGGVGFGKGEGCCGLYDFR